jgi:hypothetical protein
MELSIERYVNNSPEWLVLQHCSQLLTQTSDKKITFAKARKCPKRTAGVFYPKADRSRTPTSSIVSNCHIVILSS